MKRPLTTCFCILTAWSLLSSPCMLSASEEASEGKPELAERRHRSAMGAREGYRLGRRMGVQQERVRALMERLDSDGDHRISLAEFKQPDANPFSQMDGNEDGELTLEEMQEFQVRRLRERIEKQFASLDSNGDERVTVEEMRQDRFAHMDKDGDGYLTPRELINPRRRPGPPPGRGEE